MFHKPINRVGFGWTTRIIAFVALAGLSVSLTVLKRRLPPFKQSRSVPDVGTLKEPTFLVFAFGIFCFVGLYFLFFYLQSFFTIYLHDNSSLSFYIFSVLTPPPSWAASLPVYWPRTRHSRSN